jgi:hypothetical protein
VIEAEVIDSIFHRSVCVSDPIFAEKASFVLIVWH